MKAAVEFHLEGTRTIGELPPKPHSYATVVEVAAESWQADRAALVSSPGLDRPDCFGPSALAMTAARSP